MITSSIKINASAEKIWQALTQIYLVRVDIAIVVYRK